MKLKNGIKIKLDWSELDIILHALDRLMEYSSEDSDYPLSTIEEVYDKLEGEAK